MGLFCAALRRDRVTYKRTVSRLGVGETTRGLTHHGKTKLNTLTMVVGGGGSCNLEFPRGILHFISDIFVQTFGIRHFGIVLEMAIKG